MEGNERIIPAAVLLAVGVALMAAYGSMQAEPAAVLVGIATMLAILVPAGLVALMIAARVLGEYFGTIGPAALKVAAVIAFPFGVAVWAYPWGLALYAILQLVVLGRLYRLEPHEVGLLWIILSVISLAAMYLVFVGFGMGI